MSEELINVDSKASLFLHKNSSNKYKEKYIAVDNYILSKIAILRGKRVSVSRDMIKFIAKKFNKKIN